MRRGFDRVLGGVLLLAVLCVAAGCDSDPVQVDERPANFTLPDLEGNDFTLSSTQGQVVLLTFFAPWCPVCQSEVPALKELHDTYSDDGLVIVAVATRANSREEIEQFQENYDVPYRIVIDDGRVSQLGYGATQVPTTFIIDRDVNKSLPYGHLTEEEMVDLIEPLL
jgi:peroxiredoxin